LRNKRPAKFANFSAHRGWEWQHTVAKHQTITPSHHRIAPASQDHTITPHHRYLGG
jgi:hypothetical protein